MNAQGRNQICQTSSTHELKEIFKIDLGWKVIVHNELIYQYNKTHVNEFSLQGKLLRPIQVFQASPILSLHFTDQLLIISPEKLTTSEGNSIPLPIRLPLKNLSSLDNSLLLDFESSQHLLIDFCLSKSFEIPSKLICSIKSLKVFICLSSSEIHLISKSGKLESYDQPHANIDHFALKNTFLLSASDHFLYIDSLPSMIPLQTITLTVPLESIHCFSSKLFGGNFLIRCEKRLILRDFSDFSIKFQAEVSNCKVLSLGLFKINGSVFKLQLKDTVSKVKDLILNGNFKAATEGCLKIIRKNLKFTSEVIESLCTDEDLKNRYLLCCDFLASFKKVQMEDIARLVEFFLKEDRLDFEMFSASIKKFSLFLFEKRLDDEFFQVIRMWSKFELFTEVFQGRNWQDFKKSPGNEEIAWLLKEGRIDKAIVLFDTCKEQLSLDQIYGIINQIDFKLEFHFTESWLRGEVFPHLLSADLSRFLTWLLRKVKKMMKINIELKNILKLLDFPLKFPALGKDHIENVLNFPNFQSIREDLCTLITLKSDYSIVINFSSLSQENDLTIGLKILSGLCLASLDSKIQLLEKYCKEKKVDMDMVISKFIQQMLEEKLNDPNWMQMVSILVRSIKNTETRSRSILNVLGVAQSSSKTYEELLKYAFSYENSSFKVNFLKIKQAESFKKIKEKYTAEDVKVTQTNMVKFVSFMLNSQIHTCLEDSLEVAEMIHGFSCVEVVLMFLESVLQDLQRLEWLERIRSLVEKEELFQLIVFYFITFLEENSIQEISWIQQRYKAACSALLKLFEIFGCEDLELVNIIQNLLNLSTNYNIYLKYSEYSCRKTRKKTVKSCIFNYVEHFLTQPQSPSSDLTSKPSKPIVSFESLFKISSLLHFNHVKLLLNLAKASSKNRLTSKTLFFLDELSSHKLNFSQLSEIIVITEFVLRTLQDSETVTRLRHSFERILDNNLKNNKKFLREVLKVIQNLLNVESFLSPCKGLRDENFFFQDFPEKLELSEEEAMTLAGKYFHEVNFEVKPDLEMIIQMIFDRKGYRSALLLAEPENIKGGIENHDFYRRLMEKVLEVVTAQQNFDDILALDVLIQINDQMFVEEKLKQILDECDIDKSLKICKIAQIFCGFNKRNECVEFWKGLEKVTSFNKKLERFQVTFQKISEIQSESEQIKLLFKNTITIELALELAPEFSWKEEEVIMLYIEHLISKPVFKKSIQKSQVFQTYPFLYPFKTNFIKETRKWILKIDAVKAKDLLIHIFKKVCQVDYDRILFIIEMLLQFDSKFTYSKQVCEFLKNYKRKSDPSPEELHQINSCYIFSNEVKTFFTKVIHSCLGFTFFSNSIDEEIQLSNCDDFSRLEQLRTRDLRRIDAFYEKAIKNHIKSCYKEKVSVKFKLLQPFLDKIKTTDILMTLLNEICTFFTFSEEILKIRDYQLRKLREMEDLECLERFKKIRTIEKVKLLLFKNNLYELFGNSTVDSDLIVNLYDYLLPLLNRDQDAFDSKLIVQLVLEILNVLDVDFDEFHNGIVLKWLNDQKILFDDLKVSPSSFIFLKLSMKRDINVIKILEILNLFPKASTLEFMRNLLFQNPSRSDIAKVRTLLILAEKDWNIKEILKSSIGRNKLLRFHYYLADFHALGMNFSLFEITRQGFLTEICNSLLSNSNLRKIPLQLVASILLENDINIQSLFIKTFDLMLKMRDFDSIIWFLSLLVSRCKIMFLKDYIITEKCEVFAEVCKVIKDPESLDAFVHVVLRFDLNKQIIKEILKVLASSLEDSVVSTAFYLVSNMDEYLQTFLVSLLFKINFEVLQKFGHLLRRLELDFKSREAFLSSAIRNLKYLREHFGL